MAFRPATAPSNAITVLEPGFEVVLEYFEQYNAYMRVVRPRQPLPSPAPYTLMSQPNTSAPTVLLSSHPTIPTTLQPHHLTSGSPGAYHPESSTSAVLNPTSATHALQHSMRGQEIISIAAPNAAAVQSEPLVSTHKERSASRQEEKSLQPSAINQQSTLHTGLFFPSHVSNFLC